VISDGGKVVDTSSTIGTTSNSYGNSLVITGGGSLWSNSGSLTIGNIGSSNSLVISDGGKVVDLGVGSTASAIIGSSATSSNNSAIVTGLDSLWSNSTGLIIGNRGSSNSLVISDGGKVVDRTGSVGSLSTSFNNTVLVTGTGALWSNSISLTVGNSGNSNSLVIFDGGSVVDQTGYIGANSSNNNVTITGTGSLWSNSQALGVGQGRLNNSLIISNGGFVSSGFGYVGFLGGSNTTVLITGSGSTWSNTQIATIGGAFDRTNYFDDGSGGSGTLTLADGGVLLVGSNLIIGSGSNTVGTLNFGSFGGNDAAGSLATPLVTLGPGQATINYNQTNTLSITSAIVGNGTVQQLGAGTTIMSGDNTYTGTTLIANGTLEASSTNAFGNSALTLGGSTNTARLSLLTDLMIASLAWGSNSFLIPTAGLSNSTIQELTITGVMSNIGRGGAMDFGNYSVVGSNTIITFGSESGFSSSDFVAYDHGVVDTNWIFTINANHVIATFGQSTDTNGNLYVGTTNSDNVVDLYTATNSYNYSNTYIGYATNTSNNILNVANAGVVLNNSSNVYVGYDGNNNIMEVFNNGLVTNMNGYIGFNADASNNTAIITSGGAWKMSQGLYVGNLGSGNTLVISNGGFVSSEFGEIGYDINSSGNTVIITGSNSLWSNINTNNLNSNSYIYVGGLGWSNSMIIANGGVARDQFGAIGWGSSSSNNSVLVTGPGSLWTNGSNVYVGNLGSGNTMVISNGAAVVGVNAYVGWAETSLSNNVLVTGTGSLWSNSGNLYIGANNETNTSGQGTVTVANGGALNDQTITIGSGSTLNNGLTDGTGTSGTINATEIDLEGGTFALNGTDATEVTNSIQGNGFVSQNGSGTTILSGSNSYSGTTTILNGTLMAGTSNAFGTSAVFLGGSTTTGTLAITSTLSNVTIASLNWNSNGVMKLTPGSQTLNIIGGMVNSGGGGTFNFNVINNETNTLLAFGSETNFIAADYSILGITGYTFVQNSNNLQGYFATNANITNNAGTVALNNTLKVASYTQNSGGTLQINVSSPNVYGNIQASGNATLGSALAIIPINNTPLTYGEKLTFITAGGSINGAFSSIEVEQPGCRARFEIIGDPQAIVYIAPEYYTQVAQNQNQYNVATALNTFIPATSGDEVTVSSALDQLSASQYGNAFNQIMPTLYQSLSTIAFNLYNANNMELIQRLWGARVMEGGFSMNGFGDNTPIIEEPTRKADKNDILRPGAKNPWGLFIDGSGIFAQANSANMLPTYQAESGGVTTGLTYHWNDSFASGIYTGYQGVYTKYSAGAGSLVDNSVRFGLFGTYGQKEGKGFFVDGLIGGDYSGYTMQRNINFSTINRTATGNPGAGELDAMLASGYDLKKGNWTYGPLMSLQYAYFGVSPFNETGANSLDLNNVSWNTSSMIYSLGSHVAYRWQANKELAVVPQINLSWQHEFLQNPYNIGASLGGINFNNSSSTPLRDTLYTGIGVSLEFVKKWDASFFYNASAGNQDLISQNIFLSLGMKF
jgi:T5SS/PEP-CTERM-associated repeat protein/autotransporter-associated beta strand protein